MRENIWSLNVLHFTLSVSGLNFFIEVHSSWEQGSRLVHIKLSQFTIWDLLVISYLNPIWFRICPLHPACSLCWFWTPEFIQDWNNSGGEEELINSCYSLHLCEMYSHPSMLSSIRPTPCQANKAWALLIPNPASFHQALRPQLLNSLPLLFSFLLLLRCLSVEGWGMGENIMYLDE
jgi:hypothetical protein